MKNIGKKIARFLLYFMGFLLLLVIGFVCYFTWGVSIDIPVGIDTNAQKLEREKLDSNFYVLENNWLRKNNQGIWEMYVEGEAYKRGIINGKLAQEMVVNQEDNFVGQIKQMIPSETYLKFLKYFIVWFNRDIDDYIPDEYKKEIYGVSYSASENYSFIGTNYERILNYHAAHDIGHALQDKNLVPGCTAFSGWNGRTKDSCLIVGRNFDFFVGEGFAEDKIVCFVKPDSGYKLMFVTWGGFIGVVSGMNEKGLTVTLNASKSDMPSGSATPISIVAREILQYASNAKEAYAIAKTRKTFVSESIMIGSAEDNKTYIIEKSPSKIDMYETSSNELLCSNHFQGKVFNTEKDVKEQSSVYRFQRLQELMKDNPILDEYSFAKILRDQRGLGNKNIGMGNEKALNQLIAHHSIIFKPKQRLVWVSSNPFQLGEYVCYDLNKVFTSTPGMRVNRVINEESHSIPQDSFLNSVEYKNFRTYKKFKKKFSMGEEISEDSIRYFLTLNPEFYYTYWLVGDFYCKKKEDYAVAKKYYEMALTKEVPRENESTYLLDKINLCNQKLENK